MELKWKSGLDEDSLEALSNDALEQIKDRKYDSGSQKNASAVKLILSR